MSISSKNDPHSIYCFVLKSQCGELNIIVIFNIVCFLQVLGHSQVTPGV